MYRLAVVLAVYLAFLAAPVLAGAPASNDDGPKASVEKSVDPTPSKQRERLSTRDRWRGKPYVASRRDAGLPVDVLDKLLPLNSAGFGPGVTSPR